MLLTAHLQDSSTVVIDLPDGMACRDYFAWSPVAEVAKFSLTGDLVLKRSHKQAGRSLSFATGQDNMGAVQYSMFAALQALAAAEPVSMTLAVFGQTLPVDFRYSDGPPVSGVPLLGYSYGEADEWWSIAINLRIANAE